MELPPWFADKTGHDEEFSRRWSEEFAADKQKTFNEMATFTAELPRPFGDLPILLEGNYAVDEVGQAFEGLGKQVESLGNRVATRNPVPVVVPN